MITRSLPPCYPCYRSTNLDQILAGLGVQLIHSRPYTPQGRGKIERWFRTVREDFLAQSGEDGQILAALIERLSVWVETYNERVHSSTGQTPAARFKANLACVRPAPPDLLRHFRLTESRRVKKDRSIMLGGRLFEAPPKLIDRSVELRLHPEAPLEVEIFHDGLSYGMATVLDARINARVRRDVAAPQPPAPGRDADARPLTSLPEAKGGQLFGGRRVLGEMEIF